MYGRYISNMILISVRTDKIANLYSESSEPR